MRSHQLLTAMAAGAVAVAISPAPAWAGFVTGQASGSVSNGEVQATAASAVAGSTGDGAGQASEGGGGSQPPPVCSYVPGDATETAILGPGGPGPGTWYFPDCQFSGLYGEPDPPIWVPAGVTPGAAPSVPALIQQAQGEAALPTPSIELNPPGDQVVNFSSWLWVPSRQWSAVVATAAAGGVTATVTAAPTKVVFSMGDGDSVTCEGPGVPYDSSKAASEQSTYCSYTWPTSSASQPGQAYDVTATIYYAVTTTVHGAANPAPNLGIVASPAGAVAVHVAEVETLGDSP